MNENINRKPVISNAACKVTICINNVACLAKQVIVMNPMEICSVSSY